MRPLMARTHRILAWICLIGVALQIYFAGMALFGAGQWTLHTAFGSTLWLTTPLLLIVALIGRLDRRTVGLSALFVLLTTIQIILPWLRLSVPFVAAFHPVNAVVLLGLAYRLAQRPSGLAVANGSPTASRSRPARDHEPA